VAGRVVEIDGRRIAAHGARPLGSPRPSGRSSAVWGTRLLLAPGLLAIALLFAAPLLLFGAYAFLQGGFFRVEWSFTLRNFSDVLTDPFVIRLIVRSLVTGLMVAVLCVASALPLAYYLRFRSGRLQNTLFVLLVVALFVSYLARIYAWRAIFSSNGVFSSLLQAVGVDAPPNLLFTRTLVMIALVHIYLPFVALALYAAMRNLPEEVLHVAEDLGATPWTKWRRVLLPLMASTSLPPFMFTLVLAASDFATPQLLGGTDGTLVGVLVEQQFSEAGNYPMGAAMSLVLMAIFIAVYLLATLILFATKLHRVPVRM
jgi:spermidine/putrescine transport system permease protein